MLLPIVFLLALMLTLATALLESGLAATKIALHASVASYSAVAVAGGVADFTASLAAFVRQNGTRGPWPAAASHVFPAPLCDAATAGSQCALFSTIDATITDPSAPITSGRRRDAASNLQTSVIGERRLSAVVTATISAPNGTILGTRTRLLTYRVFEAPPYAIVSGSQDTTTVNGLRTAAQGDTGGAWTKAQDGAPLPPATSQGSAGDTRIHVQLSCTTVIADVVANTNDQQVRGNDGLPWGNAANAAHETPCTEKASPADAFADRPWTNGNANASGWTR